MFSGVSLTERQLEVLNFLKSLKQEGKGAPTYREIANHFGFKSTKSVTDHIVALEKKGYIRRRNRRSRGIELLCNDEILFDNVTSVPVVGRIPAGNPETQTQESLGALIVDKKLLKEKNADKLFALQVIGESMIGRGIHDGDWVIADKTVTPIEGSIVVALIDGESTLKTLSKKKKKYFLKAENPTFSDLVPADEMAIQGVVRMVIRQVC